MLFIINKYFNNCLDISMQIAKSVFRSASLVLSASSTKTQIFMPSMVAGGRKNYFGAYFMSTHRTENKDQYSVEVDDNLAEG